MKNSSLYKQLYILHYCSLPQLTAVSGQIPYQNYYDIKTFQCHARQDEQARVLSSWHGGIQL